MKKIALDWDESELRMVVGQVRGGSSIQVTDVAIVPIESEADSPDVQAVLRKAISERGLENTPALVAIGRGKAELRELQLPPVPDEELPDMVRFQAIRSFASAGESATVDFLVTERTESNVEMIAAAIGPKQLSGTCKVCQSAGLDCERVALRPLSSAALYLLNQNSLGKGEVVLVDLLAGDAEIVVARNGRVVFVRTVRVPEGEAARSRSLAGELKRSMLACGVDTPPDKVILWGKSSVHEVDRQTLVDASGAEVEIVDPFDWVVVDSTAREQIPEHVGRLAPLIGLLAADQSHPERLIDFLNPRHRPEEPPKTLRNAALIGVPLVAALLLGFLVYRKLSGLDARIAELKAENAEMQPKVEKALESVDRTEKVDQYLDGGVTWLEEIRRLAEKMPPSDQMIVRNISANIDPRSGGGSLQISGAAVDPEVIDTFEQSLRDESHVVVGDNVSEEEKADVYRWGFQETIKIDPTYVRNRRYERILAILDRESSETEDSPSEQDEPVVDATLDSDVSSPQEADAAEDQPESAPSNEDVDPKSEETNDGDVARTWDRQEVQS